MKILNKKAKFNYEILEKFEFGIVLLSSEVKALRNGSCNLSDSYLAFNFPHIWIYNMHIGQYKNLEHDLKRDRIILLKKKEKNKILGYINKKGATVVPLELYTNKKGYFKIICAACIGKKLYDKRLDIKKRDLERESR